MVDHFQPCEFWLPPQFLTDEDFAFHFDKTPLEDSASGSEASSPVESLLSSTESESDEDDYITELTRKMGDSILQEKKECQLSSSPKSPLCKGSGEFSRRKLVHESGGIEKVVGSEQKGLNFGFPTNHSPQLSYQQLLAIRHLQFQEVRRHQMMNQSHQNRGENGERMPMGLPVSAWPQLQRSQPQPQPGMGMMRTVFLGNNVGEVAKPRAGTGVFLPRIVASTETRKKKPACSPVVKPDKVAQALNLNLEKLDVNKQAHRRPGYNNNGISAHHGTSSKLNSKIKKNHAMQSIPREEPENQEVFRLPPEWTY